MIIVRRLTVLVLGFAACTALLVFAVLRGSLPDYSGDVTVDGIRSTVTIARDSRAVPHISADNDEDLAFGLGYVHAQDRMFQMDMNRRIGRGRAAEILGEPLLNYDRYFRTLGFTQAAERAYANLPEDGQALLRSYASGVNSYLRDSRKPLAPEFVILNYKPDFWSPVDTLIMQKMMWLDLSGNARHEVARAKLLTKLSPAQVMSLYPAAPGSSEAPLPALETVLSDSALDQLAQLLGPEKPPGYGSNNWVVSGALTKSGMPLLANDPHLGLTTPSIWYLARLHNRTTGQNVVGVSLPATPAIILGRNDHIAWGFTNVLPDIQDLYIEKLVDGDSYLTPDGPQPFTVRDETIKVRWSDDRTIQVRSTRHGPVMSDVQPASGAIFGEDYVVSMRWTALEDRDEAVLAASKLSKAKNFADFQAAGQHYFGPQQNMIYADIAGNIGYYAPARVPIRRADNAIGGRLPSPGWDAAYDWQGYIPYAELPTRFNPDSAVIATANEKIVDEDYPYFLNRDWALPYRSNRIRHRLQAGAPHDSDSFADLHGDIVSDMARDLLPWMLRAAADHPLAARLAEWDGSMDKDLSAPLIFQSWVRAYQKALIGDELGDLYREQGRIRPQLLKSGLYWEQSAGTALADTAYYALPVLDAGISLAWCDDVTTADTTETCGALARAALDSAEAKLTATYGPDADQWRWGDVHILTQTHRPFSEFPILRDMFGLTAEQSGGRYTVNVAGNNLSPDTPHTSSFGASYRGIFDLADLNKSRFVQPTGQSGHPLSRHYGDMFDTWQSVDSFEIPTTTPVPENAIGVLTLLPRP